MKWVLALALGLTASFVSELSYAQESSRAVLTNYQPADPLNTRGPYISGGVKVIFWGDKTVKADVATSSGGAAHDLRIKYDDAIYYQAIWGNAWDSSFFRFRFDTEIYFGKNDVEMTRAGLSAKGKITSYGLNLNAFYDLPTLFRLTPYVGASAMAIGVKLEFDNIPAAQALDSRQIEDYLAVGTGIGGSSGDTENFNLLYGYGFMAGSRIELASGLALGVDYRVIRFEDCVVNRGCALVLQKTSHEIRVELALRF